MRTHLTRLLAALALVAASVAGLVPAASAQAPPAGGLDDWSCRPTPEQPEPVILVHGLFATAETNWGYLGPQVAADGWCTFTLTYGAPYEGAPIGGTRSVLDSAGEIAGFVDEVLAATGAEEVSLVGHSEGGFQALYVPKAFGLADRVARVVALAPPSNGTSLSGLVTLRDVLGVRPSVDPLLAGLGCEACVDLAHGGAGIAALNDGPVAQPGIEYTILATRYDLIVTPPRRASFVAEPGVRNVWLQDVCPFSFSGHAGIAFGDTGVRDIVLNALDPDDPSPVRCGSGLPL